MFHRTQLLLDRATEYEKAGKLQSAIDLFEGLFRSGWESGRVEDVLEAALRIGFLHSARSDIGLASEYFDLVLTVAELVCDNSRAARAQNGIGVIHQRRGDLNSAEACYQNAYRFATNAEDHRTIGDIQLNLGIIAFIRGDFDDALAHYRYALGQYEKTDNVQRIARVLNNLGMLYTDMQDFASASETLNRALTICREIGDVQVEGIVLTNRTELLLAVGDLEGARTCCDEAYELSMRLENGQLTADILKSYGVIYRETGKPHLAESHFGQAISLAAELGYPLIEADTYRELALLLRGSDRNREALVALNHAHHLFSHLQAKQEQADIASRLEQLESDFLSLVARWGDSIEAKDRYTQGHCQRVAEYACRLADLAQFPASDIKWFRMGALLHDLGKIAVPEAILNKPGPLTEDERAIMERHTIVGDEMLSSIEFPWDIRPMVRWHHERWDGRGYPDGLAGDDIPISARILHIADVFDALTSARSYRKPLTPEEAWRLMLLDSGSFDPDLLSIFETLIPTLSAAVIADQEI